MDMLLHPADAGDRDRPSPRGRLSSIGHRAAFRAFARAAKRAGLRYMVIGGTFRDVAIRSASTRDIDIVLVDRKEIDPAVMEEAGFSRVPQSRHAWRYVSQGRPVDLEVAATASSTEVSGPFSVAFQNSEMAVVEGVKVNVPRVDDYVILKLIAAHRDRRRRARDLVDVQYALEAFPRRAGTSLSVASVRARLRDRYGIEGQTLKEIVSLFRAVPRRAR